MSNICIKFVGLMDLDVPTVGLLALGTWKELYTVVLDAGPKPRL